MVEAGGDGIQRKVELVIPAELEACLGQLPVPRVGVRMALREAEDRESNRVGLHKKYSQKKDPSEQ